VADSDFLSNAYQNSKLSHVIEAIEEFTLKPMDWRCQGGQLLEQRV
jgi:hypothetical protein